MRKFEHKSWRPLQHIKLIHAYANDSSKFTSTNFLSTPFSDLMSTKHLKHLFHWFKTVMISHFLINTSLWSTISGNYTNVLHTYPIRIKGNFRCRHLLSFYTLNYKLVLAYTLNTWLLTLPHGTTGANWFRCVVSAHKWSKETP